MRHIYILYDRKQWLINNNVMILKFKYMKSNKKKHVKCLILRHII